VNGWGVTGSIGMTVDIQQGIPSGVPSVAHVSFRYLHSGRGLVMEFRLFRL
jgi:hypothetical protein